MHVKVVNMNRSVGFQVQMDGLTHIEGMLTNFNKIVSQDALINKISVCFDLPVTPAPAAPTTFSEQLLQSKEFQPSSLPNFEFSHQSYQDST
jgi:hypothetical protein